MINRLETKFNTVESTIYKIKDELSKKRMLLSLENELILSKNIIENYPEELKKAQRELEDLRSLSGGTAGFIPTEIDLAKASNRVIAISERAGEAEITIENLEPQIEALKAEIEEIEAGRIKANPESVVKSEFTEVDNLCFDTMEDFQNYHNNRR